MKKGGVSHEIHKILKGAGEPLSAYRIYQELFDRGVEVASLGSLKVMLSQNHNNYNKVKRPCEDCGHMITYFSLSEYGRMALADLERVSYPLSQEEYRDFGIEVSEGG